ncbi:hypothetical protein B0T18DRAFT_404176 [Schizothecium vesticola]|uniref:Uncharacterized protein n=1 Tax=Schizothecium vesticola TaxID=314040 RepID=A0AA40KAX2_9PEZI|nr:hypothetical protein B0T18DRAFT_404176 [Schizothecium vesticola]
MMKNRSDPKDLVLSPPAAAPGSMRMSCTKPRQFRAADRQEKNTSIPSRPPAESDRPYLPRILST